MQNRRLLRVASLMEADISRIVQRFLSDLHNAPHLAVTRVRMSADLKYASVFISSSDEKQALALLRQSSDHIRHQLARVSLGRFTPHLRFIIDDTWTKEREIHTLLATIQKDIIDSQDAD